MKYNNYSEDEIIKLYHHYKSANKVISKTGIYKFKVYEILARNKDLSFTNIEENLIKEVEFLYKDNIAINNIAKQLNVSYGKIKLILAYLGIDNRKRTSKYKLNENYFEKIDNEHKAYWLGFLYADGCVGEKRNRVELALQEQDYNHILKFKKFLKSEHKIGIKIKNGIYKSYRLGFNNAKIKQDLIALGCLPQKTKQLQFPTNDQVPDYLLKHFIRGYLDADGCIRKGTTTYINIELLGYESILKPIVSFFNLEGHIYRFKHSDVKRFIIGGSKAQEILDMLYKDATIYLDRKYKKYLELSMGRKA